MDITPTPIFIGLLYDFPQGDEGVGFELGLRLGIESVYNAENARPVEFMRAHVRGLPIGSEHEVVAGFRALVETGALMIVGPAISDNALITAPLADQYRIAAINYSGGERTRSKYMLQIQLGSLEEEPAFIAQRLLERGFDSVAVIFDDSPVGRRYYESFEAARSRLSISVTAAQAISPLSTDIEATVASLRTGNPDALVYFGLGLASRAVALALEALSWNVAVVANSSLMFGYVRPDWRDGFRGWEYVDTIADSNPVRQALAAVSPSTAATPTGCAAYDIGVLIGAALTHCSHLTRVGLMNALYTAKRLPAVTGMSGTTMGFGNFDHGALKGEFLVLREWIDGASREVDRNVLKPETLNP